MLDLISSRARELQGKGLRPFDALIVAYLEAGDSVEQVARRMGVTVKAVRMVVRRGESVTGL